MGVPQPEPLWYHLCGRSAVNTTENQTADAEQSFRGDDGTLVEMQLSVLRSSAPSTEFCFSGRRVKAEMDQQVPSLQVPERRRGFGFFPAGPIRVPRGQIQNLFWSLVPSWLTNVLVSDDVDFAGAATVFWNLESSRAGFNENGCATNRK